jgi:hypothetical protein
MKKILRLLGDGAVQTGWYVSKQHAATTFIAEVQVAWDETVNYVG